MARLGGNPELRKYSYSTDRDEPCTAVLTFKIGKSDLEKIKAIPNYRELLRQKVKEIIEANLSES